MFGSRTQPTQPPLPPPPGPSPPAGPSFTQPPSLPEPSASPLKNVDAVKTYLEQSGGRPLNQVEIAGLVSMLQDSIDGADGTHAFLRLALCRNSSNPSYRSQMTLNHSVFRKAHHVRAPQPPARYFLPLPRPPYLPQQKRRKRQPGHCPKTRTERIGGKVLEVHAATGITRLRSDHLALGTRSSFPPRKRQRAIRRGDVLARMQRLRLHRSPPPVVGPLLNQLPLVPLRAPVRLM